MRLIHVIHSIQKQASGPTYSVVSLAAALARRGHEVELHVLAPAPDVSDRGFRLVAYPPSRLLRRFGGSSAARRGLKVAARTADIMHVHGMWRMPHVHAAAATVGTECRLLFSPRGSLSAWAMSWHRLQKRLMWAAFVGRALRRAHLFHATAQREAEEIRAAGFTVPIAVVPNGTEVQSHLTPRVAREGTRRVLFLGRIHPIKGVDRLLHAWRLVESETPGWELHIVGFDEAGYTAQMQALTQQLRLSRVRFAPPVYGEAKEALLRDTDLFVLPSHTENFSIAVAEALARGIPVIATRGTPWEGLEEQRCGWWVDGAPESLARSLREALSMPAERLVEFGGRGRAWVERDLRWERVAEQMEQTYAWMRVGGSAPPWILPAQT
jgi:glycosyltransferase involved in cell wall biosynthesis